MPIYAYLNMKLLRGAGFAGLPPKPTPPPFPAPLAHRNRCWIGAANEESRHPESPRLLRADYGLGPKIATQSSWTTAPMMATPDILPRVRLNLPAVDSCPDRKPFTGFSTQKSTPSAGGLATGPRRRYSSQDADCNHARRLDFRLGLPNEGRTRDGAGA